MTVCYNSVGVKQRNDTRMSTAVDLAAICFQRNAIVFGAQKHAAVAALRNLQYALGGRCKEGVASTE
jgi:hypothetical protein